MKVEAVALEANQRQQDEGVKTMSPELLAAIGAKYSRSNKGLDEIYDSVDSTKSEKSIDNIFKFIDYGHQSIADMVPIPMFIDGVSMWLAYSIFAECPTASGQESSTRYIDYAEGDDLFVDEKYLPKSHEFYDDMVEGYIKVCRFWEQHLENHPEALDLSKFSKESERKRIRRNYIFDRARYFLPIASKTNLFILQSARDWVKLARFLMSHILREFNDLGLMIRNQLEVSSPRMFKHAKYSNCSERVSQWDFFHDGKREELDFLNTDPELTGAFVDLAGKNTVNSDTIAYRENRYDDFSKYTKNIPVRFGWSHLAFGDLRDLNRHRTGEKLFSCKPQGVYYAEDQCFTPKEKIALCHIAAPLCNTTALCIDKYKYNPSYVYLGSLGTQFGFSHLTTMNHFIYEAELRTGKGSHFRYARHMKDVLEIFYKSEPKLKGRIFEGSSEPE